MVSTERSSIPVALVRVTGGSLAGRRLSRAPEGVRPSADRLRESLFARLGTCEGLRVLDLYAGAGTLGIEALSRGALEVVFVERSARSLAALRANLRALELEDRSRVMRGEVGAVQRRLGRALERFDLILLDPPYGQGVAEPALRGLVDAGRLAEQGVVILERSRHHPVDDVPGLVSGDERRYGDSVTCWFRRAECPAPGPVAESTQKDSEAE